MKPEPLEEWCFNSKFKPRTVINNGGDFFSEEAHMYLSSL